MPYFLYWIWGGVIGFFSGILGIGGGVLIIPTLIYLFGLTQHQAQGTSVAMMVPPIGILAAYRYWQSDNVNLPIAILGAFGFLIGGYFGAGVAHYFPEIMLKRSFGAVLILIGLKMIIG